MVVAINNTESSDKIRLLKKILDDIRNGSATLQDYDDYERIIKEIGGDTAQVHSTLESHHLRNWQDYINKRKAANTYEKRRKTDAAIAGTLVAIGLMAILFAISKDK